MTRPDPVDQARKRLAGREGRSEAQRLAEELAQYVATIPNVRVSVVANQLIVEGEALSDADLSKVDRLAERFPQILNFTNKAGWEKMITLDVRVVEFPTTELEEIGLRWRAVGGAVLGGIWRPITRDVDVSRYEIDPFTSGLGVNGGPITGGPPFPESLRIRSLVNLGIAGVLNLLVQNGKATILAQPQSSARSGSRASFLAGGELPYSVASVNGVTVSYKPYGIRLDIQPRLSRDGRIRAAIETEVSSIDPVQRFNVNGPSLLTRRTSTEFNVAVGETLVLGGLLSKEATTDIDKVPLLGDIPVLGALFRSKRFQNRETELVVFVTPSVIDGAAPNSKARVDEVNSRLGSEPARRSEAPAETSVAPLPRD